MFVKIKSIEKAGVRTVYDISVEDDHSYVANGIINHNSSTEPNMQNVPRVTTNPDIKPMFIPPPGYLWVELDYSQAELRIVAELAREEKMIQWFKEGHNIHVAVAIESENFGTGKNYTYEEIYPITKDESHPDHKYWKKRKKRAKTINFGILYGQTGKKLSETLNFEAKPEDRVTEDEAEEFKENWLNTFPAIGKWIKKQHKKVKRDGYVINMFGFKRRLPKVYSDKFGERLEAERQSVNAPIQGAASFFTLFSAIVIEELRMKGQIPLDFPMAYTVHDSLGFFVKPEKVHEFAKIAIPVCANPQTKDFFGFSLKHVNMKASMEVGTNWGHMADYDSKKDYTQLLKT